MSSRERTRGRSDGCVWKGLAAGVAGGIVASVVMNQFQALLGKLTAGVERSHGAQSLQHGSPEHNMGLSAYARQNDDEDDDATMRLANVIAQGLFGYELSKTEKHIAGTALHYAYGISMGAFYGAVAEVAPVVTIGAGLPYGMSIWVFADEGIVPALGLSKPPTEYPLRIHAYAFSSHLVYGLTTELVRRAVRRALDGREVNHERN